jgi:hypothetical protein
MFWSPDLAASTYNFVKWWESEVREFEEIKYSNIILFKTKFISMYFYQFLK